MDTTDYWPMVTEYSIWNAAIASLQFWTADHDPVTLGSAMEEVYSAFFYSLQVIHSISNLMKYCLVTL